MSGEEGSEGRGGRRTARWVARLAAAFVGLVLLAAAGGILVLSQTVMGRQMAGDLVRDALQGAVRGEVQIGPITGGNLLTEVSLERLVISGPDGRPFLRIHGVSARYSPLGFLRDRYVFREVSIERGEIHLLQDSTGTWNFEEIFGDTAGAGPDTAEAGIHLALHDVRVGDGRLVVRLPMEPPSPGEEVVWNTVRAPDGDLRRALDVDSLSARFPRLLISDPEDPMSIQVEGGSGVARVVTQPLVLREAELSAVFRDTVDVRIGRLSTEASSVSGRGWVAADDPIQYAFDLRADPLSFRDLRWLPLPVPASGGGSMELGLRSVGEDLAVEVRDGDVSAGESRLLGGFAVRLSDPPRFDTLDVELAPYRLALTRELGADTIPMDGSVRGRVQGRGPMDGLSLAADLALRRPGAPEEGASGIGIEGRVGLVPPYRLRSLDLAFRDFEPRWIRLVGVASRLGGRVDGGLLLEGRADSAISFRADLVHRLPGDSVSRVRGAGDIRTSEPPRVDVALDLRPLALASLGPYFPNLGPVGTVRGQVSAVGALDSLAATADLATPRGELRFDGRFDLMAPRRTYDARLTARDIQLQQWFDEAPVTRLAIQGRLQGVGTEPASLRAEADLRILPSMVQGARLDSSLLRFRFADGLATVDTFAIESDVGRVWGRGALGLEEGRSGALVLMADAPELSRWNRWIVEGRNPVEPDTSLDDLFEGLDREARPGEAGEPGRPAAALPDTLSGELAARGVAFGNVHDLSVGGRVTAREVSYGAFGGDSLVLTMDATDPIRMDSLGFRLVGWRVRTPVTTLDTLYAQISRLGAARNDYRVFARRDTLLALASRGSLGWEANRKSVRLEELALGLGRRRLSLVAPGSVVYADSGLFLDSLRLAGQEAAAVSAGGHIRDRGPAALAFRVDSLPVAGLTMLLPLEDTLSGTLSGGLQVAGTADEPRITGEFVLSDPRYGTVGYRELSTTMDYRDRSAGVGATLLGEGGRTLARIDGAIGANLAFRSVADRFPEDPVDVRIRSDSLPIGWLGAAMGGSLREVSGFGEADVRVRGGPGRFRFEGSARLTGASAAVPSLGIALRSVRGAFRFRDSVATVDSLEFRSASGGRGSVSGRVTLATFTDPGLDLELRARELRAIDRRKASAVLDGRGRLTGSYRSPDISGEFQVMKGDIRMEQYLREREVVDLTDPQAFALLDTTMVAERRLIERLQNPFLQNMAMDVLLHIGPDLWLRSPDLTVEVAGDLRVRMRPAEQSLALFGSLRLLRGTYRYGLGPYSRELQIESGTIEFVGTPGVNPNLNVVAVYRTRAAPGRLTIRATVGGTLLDKRLSLSSNPPLSESDQLCYLLVGTSCVGAGGAGGEGAGLARQVPRQLLGTVGTQLSSLLVEDAWLDYLNVSTPGFAETGTGTGDDFVASGSLFAGTQLEAGKYLGRNFFVTVSQTLGSRLPGASVEWTFTENWTLEARTENRFGRLGAISIGSALEVDRTWGLFLFREWSW